MTETASGSIPQAAERKENPWSRNGLLKGPRASSLKKTDRRSDLSSVETGSVLLSRAVSHRVSSALKSLTTVFGMGTGVTSSLLPPDSFALAIFADHFVTARSSLGHVSQYAPSLIPCVPCPPRTCLRAHFESWYPQIRITLQVRSLTFFAICWPSSRSISIGQLHTLLHFHLRPINVVVSHGPYLAGEISSRGGLRT